MAQMSETSVKMGGQVYVEADAVKESKKRFEDCPHYTLMLHSKPLINRNC